MTLLPCPYCGSEVKYGHLTCDMYRKYRHLIPNLDNWWWLATAYSTKSNGYASYACIVRPSGTLIRNAAHNAFNGVRPAFLIKSSIFKSRNQDLSSFTIEELLREVLLRNIGDNNDK